jgi:hypothetical protein
VTKTKLQAEHIHMVFTRDGKTTSVLKTSASPLPRESLFVSSAPLVVANQPCSAPWPGFLSPTSGEITIDGEASTDPTPGASLSSRSAASFPGSP